MSSAVQVHSVVTANHSCDELNVSSSVFFFTIHNQAKSFAATGPAPAGGSLIFCTFTTYMQKYLMNSAGMSIRTASTAMTGCLFLYMCMQPLSGALSDRIGRRSNMLAFGALGVGLAYAISNAIFGGSAEYVTLALKSAGHQSSFYWYVTAMMALAFVVSLRLPREARHLRHED